MILLYAFLLNLTLFKIFISAYIPIKYCLYLAKRLLDSITINVFKLGLLASLLYIRYTKLVLLVILHIRNILTFIVTYSRGVRLYDYRKIFRLVLKRSFRVLGKN